MKEFKEYINKAENYMGQVSEASLTADHRAIFEFAEQRTDLVTEFEDTIHSDEHSNWRKLAKRKVMYYIEKCNRKVDYNNHPMQSPSIMPMIWSDINRNVAVIKVTM